MSLNVVALVSGGKDSLFSLAHCVQNGHKVIALANLHPGSTTTTTIGDGEQPDLNSFMYQTVGHSIVPLYADALGVPLFRKVITGTALQNGRYYDTSSTMGSADEIEDMYTLVKEILKHHPEINALSAGAILSTYQRTRVESVATRLGLVPLAYLWQYPALPPPLSRGDSLTGLLDDMSTSRCDARIIKIASGGVPSTISFSNIAHPSTRARLVSGMAPFFADSGQEFWLRGAVLGEGGEYETLALDGPGFLWKKKIQIDGCETYEAEAGTVYVQLGQASLVQRDAEQEVDLPIPVLMDKRFIAVQSQVLAPVVATISSPATAPSNSASTNQIDVRSDFIMSSSTVQIFNLTAPGATAAKQLETIITTLPFVIGPVSSACKLPSSRFASRNIVSTTLLLHSMEDFASVNLVYSTKLWEQGVPNPPARVTVASRLPRGARVSLTFVYDISTDTTKNRKGLHVQSRSYWAPANIGPYSQAVSVPVFGQGSTGSGGQGSIEVVHLAGQIPLVPSTMSMLDASFTEQAALAIQHLWRVAQERGVDCWMGAGIAFLAHNTVDEDDEQSMFQWASQAAQIWRKSNEIDEKGHTKTPSTEGVEPVVDHDDDEDEDFDVWNLQQRYRGFALPAENITVGEHLHRLPNRDISVESWSQTGMKTKSLLATSPFIAAEVVGLPRNASIEWWSTGIAELISMTGTQRSKVLSVPSISQSFWSLSGVALEDNCSEKIDTTKEGATSLDGSGPPVPEQRALCFFITLVIESNVAINDLRSVPQTLQDLIPHLVGDMESTSSLQYEVVTATSFVNLSCPAAVSIHEKVQLLQKSCIIPCVHVWSSQSEKVIRTRKAADSWSGKVLQESELIEEMANIGDNLERGIDVDEVAAAVVIRVDAFSR